MRGDSRIDFYAKSLALVGLGLLGATGAAIDYWPGDVRLPRVATIPATLVTPSVQTSIDLRGLESFTPSGAGVVRASFVRSASPEISRLARTTIVANDTAHSEKDAAPAIAEGWLVHSGVVRGLPVLSWTAPAPEPTMDVESLPPGEAWHPLPAPEMAMDQSSNGFLSGILKKTGSSVGTSLSTVSNSLGKASTSLVGAVRAVGDAVKKAF